MGCVVGFTWLGNALREAGDAEKNDSVLLREMMHGVANNFAVLAARSQAEQLRVLSTELRTIFHAAAVGITCCSRDLRYVAANETYAAIAGLPLSDIVGRPIAEVMGEAALAAIRPYVDQVLNGECVEYEAEVPWNGTGGRQFHIIYTPQRNAHDVIVGWIASVAEITKHKQVEADLRAQQERVAADLEALTRLQEVGNHCVRPGNDVEECIALILDTAIRLTGASRGNLQLLESTSGGLVIKVQRGFDKPFLDFFSHVHGKESACGLAMLSKNRIVIEDVKQSPIFAGKPALDVLLEAGVRGLQSTPLLSSADNLIGMLSTHFDRPTRLGDRELRLLDLLGRQAADYLERKQAEQQLRDSEQLAHEQFTELANLYQHAPVGLCLLDRELRYLRINQRLAEMNGIPVEQHIGRKVQEVVPAIATAIEDVTRHILATGRPVIDQEQYGETAAQPSMTRYWMVSWYPVKDREGSIYGFGVVVGEVTERKRAEVALQASEAKFAGILEIAGDAIISMDGNHRITLFNEAAERLFGYSRAEMSGQPMDLLIPARFRAAHQEHIEHFTSGPNVPRRMAAQREVPGLRKNGEEFPIEASISKVKIGEEWVSTVVLRDITERKRAEERQRVLVAELDHRVKNVLASVSAVVSHTQQESTSLANFTRALDERIHSMARTHELLSSGRWQAISLTELVWHELAPYATSDNTEIIGPEILVKSEAGQAMAMVLHELATSAGKYGALSTEKGRVLIRWAQRPDGHSRSNLVLEWQEIGGPPVVAAGKPSYGTSTIRDLIPYEFGGTVDLVLAPEGVRCRLELPVDWLRDDGDHPRPRRTRHTGEVN